MPKRIYETNKKKLARECGVAHTTLLKMWKLPDAPRYVAGKGWLIDQCKRFVEAKKQYIRDTSAYNGRPNANLRDEAYIKRQEIAAATDQFKLEVSRGKYSLKQETREQVMTYFGMLVREGDKAFLHELPPRLEGLSAGEIAKLLGKRWNEIRDRVATSLEGKNGHNRVAVA